MIPALAISLLAVAGFGLGLWRARIGPVARRALTTTMVGLSAMTDSDLDDDTKEVAVRRAGVGLIVASLDICLRILVSLAVAAAPILVADGIGLVSRDAVFALMLRLDYIVAVSVIAIALAAMGRRWYAAPARPATVSSRYSAADRVFHLLAFSSPAVLQAASWLEDRAFSSPEQTASAPPVFVTSLARGGTTALLNALHSIPGMACHTYRDMPFLTAPNLWNLVAGGQRRHVARRRRAHEDGLEIDLDSPEAFEEVIWKMFWPDHFQAAAITPWRTDDRNPEAEQFLKRHMEKVIRARLGPHHSGETARYCSKNNANIARIPYLGQAFPGCRIVVPVRRPECHAASLLRQHRNFLELQADDEFVLRYMRDIGHFDFGRIHKPIGFPGFDAARHDPATGDYWLSYWIHAFREVLRHGDSCIIVLQDDLRATPEATMARLCRALELETGPVQFSPHFRTEPDEARTDIFDQDLYGEAAELYRELERRARAPGI